MVEIIEAKGDNKFVVAKMRFFFWIEKQVLWKRKNMLVTSNLMFSRNVFKRLFLPGPLTLYQITKM